MSRRDPVEFDDCECIRETEMAILVRMYDRDEEERWFPKSVVHDDSEVINDGDCGTLVVYEWFAEKEGLV